jgi:serine phosphatase RsbU (regulator of sigma subunit)
MRFTIGRRIGLGFGIVVFLILIIFYFTFNTLRQGSDTLNESIEKNKRFNDVTQPTIELLIRLKETIFETKTLINKWATEQTREDDQSKIRLKKITTEIVPSTVRRLEALASEWSSEEDKDRLQQNIFKNIEELFSMHETYVTSILVDFDSYNDPSALFLARPAVQPDGEISKKTQQITHELDDFINRKNAEAASQKDEMNKSFEVTETGFAWLKLLVVFLGLALFIGTIVIATLTSRSIVGPVDELKLILFDLGKGIFPKTKMKARNDEIGEMTLALDNLVEGLKRTTDFSREVGSGNFEYDYQPLSEEDVLGHALLKMRDELAENERVLEQKVIERTEEVVRQKEEIENQRQKLEELYKDVTDSIRYAKRLQDSILPPESFVKQLLPESFVLFRPKDIVSGDFYWMEETNNKILFSAVDCTGHGVPGAFMSIVGANALNQAVAASKLDTPGLILDELHRLSSEALNKTSDEKSVRDGMDLAMCALSKDYKTLEYAGANNPLYILRNDEIIQIKADKFPIGGFEVGQHNYATHKFDLQDGDMIYIFSDGYADQFGGSKGKKFMYRQFREVLMDIRNLPMNKQKQELERIMEEWKGTYEQVDDVLVIGVKINLK